MENEKIHTRLIRNEKTLNPLGEFIENVRMSRGIPIVLMGEKIGLSGLGTIRTKPTETISLYTICKILEASTILNYTEDEQNALADAVESVIATTFDKKGELYPRIPPLVPKARSIRLDCVTFTDTDFARQTLGHNAQNEDIANLASRISYTRKKLEIPVVFDDEQAEKIVDSMNEINKIREEWKRVKSPIGKLVVDKFGFKRDDLNDEWLLNENGYPRIEEFSKILQDNKIQEVAEELLEELSEMWLKMYREALPPRGKVMKNEFGVSSARIGQLIKKVNPNGTLSNWQTIEAIREWRTVDHSDLLREASKKRLNKLSIASLAREYKVSVSLVTGRAKELMIADRRHLTEEEGEKLRKALDLPLRRRGPKTL